MGVSPKSNSKSKPAKQAVLLLDWAVAAIWLVIVYATGSLALDSGSWWHYGATLVALVFLVRSIRIAIMRSYGNR
jgi:membrane protein YdbS with pleckstrin-like domain